MQTQHPIPPGQTLEAFTKCWPRVSGTSIWTYRRLSQQLDVTCKDIKLPGGRNSARLTCEQWVRDCLAEIERATKRSRRGRAA